MILLTVQLFFILPILSVEIYIEIDSEMLPGPDENWMNMATEFCRQFRGNTQIQHYEDFCVRSLIENFASKDQESLAELLKEQLLLLEQVIENQERILQNASKLKAVFNQEKNSLQNLHDALSSSKAILAEVLMNIGLENPPDYNTNWLEFAQFLQDRVPEGTLVKARLPDKYTPFFIHTHSPLNCRFLSMDLIIRGIWDPYKTLRILDLMEQGRQQNPEGVQFLDLGAHLGWFTLAVAAQGHAVIAVEPMQRNYEKMLRSIEEANQLSGVVYLHTVAASDTTREDVCIQPYEPEKDLNTGNGQLKLTNATECAEVVRTARLDKMLEIYETLNLWVMKLDLEGHEPFALRGAEGLFDSDSGPCYVFSEFDEEQSLRDSGKDSAYHDLFQIMVLQHGYTAYLEGSPKELGLNELTKEADSFGSEYEFRREFDPRCFPTE